MPKRKPWSADSEMRLASQHAFGFNAAAHEHDLVPGEETLTDSVMLGLKRRRFPYVRFRGRLPDARRIFVHQFTLPQEKKVGADWNLMLISPTGRVSFRVQAKRLYATGAYTRRKGKQHARLLAVSAAQGAVPLYAFYNGPVAGSVTSACSLPEQERLGCTVVPARIVDALPAASWTNAGIGSLAIPIECLFACQCYGSGWTGGSPPPGGKQSSPVSPPTVPSALKALRAPVAEKLEPDVFELETAAEVAAAVDAWFETGEAGALENVAAELFPGVSHVVIALVNSPVLADE